MPTCSGVLFGGGAGGDIFREGSNGRKREKVKVLKDKSSFYHPVSHVYMKSLIPQGAKSTLGISTFPVVMYLHLWIHVRGTGNTLDQKYMV